jgi:hypothetical protein
MDLQEVGRGGGTAFVNVVMNLWVPKMQGISWLADGLLAFQGLYSTESWSHCHCCCRCRRHRHHHQQKQKQQQILNLINCPSAIIC